MIIWNGEIIRRRGRMAEVRFEDGAILQLPLDGLPGEKITVVIGRSCAP